MGQRANGILYGVEAPEGLPPTDDDESPAYELVRRWEKAKNIDWMSREQLRIRHEHEGEKDLLGVWVAVGGSGEDGVPYFMEQAMRIEDVPEVYIKSIVKAKKLWERFAAWCLKTERIGLPKPTLWLTPCETA